MNDGDRKSAGQIKKRAYEKPVLVLLNDMTAVHGKLPDVFEFTRDTTGAAYGYS